MTHEVRHSFASSLTLHGLQQLPKDRATVLTTLNAISQRLDHFERVSGIYFLMNQGDCIYVGQSISVYTRLGQHLKERYGYFDSIAILPMKAGELDRAERAFIELLKPALNRTHKGHP